MSLSDETLAVARKYTDDSLAGAGAVAGVPCKIQSITAITGGNRVTFFWTDNNGDDHTSAMDVMNGVDGEDGKGIQSVTVNAQDHLIITYTDGTTVDAGQIEIHSAVDSVNGQTGAVVLDAEDVGALPDDTPIPSKTSDLTNDSGFITKVVNDLVNYYLKSETYSKTEVDDIVTAIKNSRFEVVATLPTTDIKTNVIYLVPKSPSQTSNVKDEYINLNGTTAGWEKIGDTEIDLSDYVTTQALNTALADYTTTADLTTLLAGKQDTLTFDNVPTENSNNPVKSGGVYAANQTLMNNVDVLFETGVKNICPPYSGSYSANGITYIGNSDGTVTVNGTCSANIGANVRVYLKAGQYKVSGCPRGGSYSTYRIGVTTDSWTLIGTHDHGNGTTITIPSDDYYRINLDVREGYVANNLVFKPMITDVDTPESDYDHYVPYAKTNKQLTDDAEALTSQANDMVNVLGAKNVLPFPYYAGSGTYNGVTITDNGDGSITLDGTCTGMSFFVFYGGRYSLAPTTFVKKNEDYIATLEVVSGSMAINSGTSRFVFRNYITNATSPFVDIFYEDNVIDTRSVKFTYEPTASYDTSLVWYEFNVGTTFNNWRIRPMIRLASIQDNTYVPYAKTNQQLTEDSIDWDNFSELGAVNMLDSAIATQTVNDITVTNNGDGSYTVNCSSTEHNSANFISTKKVTLPKGTYKWTASADGKSPIGSNDCYAFIRGVNGTVDWYRSYQYSHGYGIITLTQDSEIEFGLTVATNATVSNLTFKPMITPASYDGPYVPYAKTNKELTDELTVGALSATANTDYLNGTNNVAFRKYGKMVSCEGYFQVTTAAARAAVLYTLAELPLGSSFLLAFKNTGVFVLLNAKTDGTIIVESEGGIAAGFYSLVGTFVLP